MTFEFRRCRSLPTIRDGNAAHTSGDKATEMASHQVQLDVKSSANSFSTDDMRLLYRPLLVLMLLLPCCFIKQLTTSVVTSISLLLSVYLFYWAASLSEKMTVTLQAIVRVSYVPLLAFFVGNSWRPFVGMVVMYLNTIVAAGSCGYALANRRQRMGTETPAEIAALCLPLHRKERKERGFGEPDLVPVAFLLCLASLGFAVWTVWISCTYSPGDAVAAVLDLSGWLAMGLFAWNWFVDTCLMECAIFSSYTMGLLFVSSFMFFFSLMAMFVVIFGDSGAAIITWITAIISAGLFGYTVAVYHQFNSRRVSQQGKGYQIRF